MLVKPLMFSVVLIQWKSVTRGSLLRVIVTVTSLHTAPSKHALYTTESQKFGHIALSMSKLIEIREALEKKTPWTVSISNKVF